MFVAQKRQVYSDRRFCIYLKRPYVRNSIKKLQQKGWNFSDWIENKFLHDYGDSKESKISFLKNELLRLQELRDKHMREVEKFYELQISKIVAEIEKEQTEVKQNEEIRQESKF